MSTARIIRPRLSRFTFAFLGLGICVFTWGLQYKLSLYYPAHSSYHQVPEAKLLSKNEQSRTVGNLKLESRKEPLSDSLNLGLLALTLAWLTGVALVPERGFLSERTRPWLAAAQASLDAFFFRPPPISA